MFGESIDHWNPIHVGGTESTAGLLVIARNIECSLETKLTLCPKNERRSQYRCAYSSIGVRICYTSSGATEVFGDLLEAFLVKIDKVVKVFQPFLGNLYTGICRKSHLSQFIEESSRLSSSNNHRSCSCSQ